MKSLIKIGTVLAVASLMLTGAFAQGKKAAPKMAKKAPQASCPVCHMFVAAKPTKASTVAIKLNGKTMYCCSKCTMPASMLAKSMGKKTMGKKSMGKKPMAKKK